MSVLHIYEHPGAFRLESAREISRLKLAYQVWGQPNAARDNIVWVLHAFSGSPDCFDWWKGLVGHNDLINDKDYCIICANMPGSCYGSTSPLSLDTVAGAPYYYDFPVWTTRDVARAFDALREHLGFPHIYLGLGGSLGGQVLLEWAVEKAEVFKNICVIAASATHTPYGIAFNTAQRQAIALDPTWGACHPAAGENGLKVARSIALLSYRTAETYRLHQSGVHPGYTGLPVDQQVFKASTYQWYQGEKMAKRFTALSYYFLTRTMDSHDVGRDRGGPVNALQQIKARTLILSLENDQLFPFDEQLLLTQYIPDSNLEVVATQHGHDGFLLELDQITLYLSRFLKHTGHKNAHFTKFHLN